MMLVYSRLWTIITFFYPYAKHMLKYQKLDVCLQLNFIHPYNKIYMLLTIKDLSHSKSEFKVIFMIL